MHIVTNSQPRPLVYKYELTAREQVEFDYLDDHAELFRYKGNLYPLSDYVRIVRRADAVGFEHGADDGSPLLEWDGIATDSYFSAIVVRYDVADGTVTVGRVSW